MKIRKFFVGLISLVLLFSMTTSVFASNYSKDFQGEDIQLLENIQLLEMYVDQLEVTEEEPYKELYIPEHNVIIYKSVTVNHNEQVNKANLVQSASNVESASITTSQGMKNIFGVALFELDYTTSWSYNYSQVLSSYSYVAVRNGLGWSFKGSTNNGPLINDYGREHEWTGTANFAMIVAGIDISNETLINQHRVRYDGSYAWRYDSL